MENSMKTANYNRFINFMTKLESQATTTKERDVINSARGMFAKCAQFEGTAATMDVNMAAKSRSPEFGMMSHNGPKAKPMTQAEKDAFDNDKCHQFHLMLDESQIYQYTINSQMYAFLHNEPIVQPRLLNYI